MNVNNDWDIPQLKQDTDSDLSMMQKGHTKDIDFMNQALSVYIDGRDEEIINKRITFVQ